VSLALTSRPPGAAKARIGYLPQRHNFDSSVRVRGIDLVEGQRVPGDNGSAPVFQPVAAKPLAGATTTE